MKVRINESYDDYEYDGGDRRFLDWVEDNLGTATWDDFCWNVIRLCPGMEPERAEDHGDAISICMCEHEIIEYDDLTDEVYVSSTCKDFGPFTFNTFEEFMEDEEAGAMAIGEIYFGV